MGEQAKPKERVLIVDDEPHIGKIFSIKLRLAGYDVITTTRGAEAIELIRTHHPDIILLDIFMPDVNGLDVLSEVRTFSAVPVIIFSARPGVEELATRYGANDSIAKPFDPDTLVEKIRLVLQAEGTST